MCVDVSQLVVHVEEAAQTLLGAGDGPVARQDVLVELQVGGRLVEFHQPRAVTRTHHPSLPTAVAPDDPQPVGTLQGYILRWTEAHTLRTGAVMSLTRGSGQVACSLLGQSAKARFLLGQLAASASYRG